MIVIAFVFSAFLWFYGGYLLVNAWHFSRIPQRLEGVLPKELPASSANSGGSDLASLPFVSVVIPARNEAASIAACLKSVLDQSYPADCFEVILVNDHSTDATKAIATELASQVGNLHVLDLEAIQGPAYKKAALALGIQHARGTIILTTDADCFVDPDWINLMVGAFGADVGLASGPVVLEGDMLFQQFQALEFMGLIATGAGSMQAGRPNMANGANLGFRKAVFEAVGGYSGIDHLASGDDELLLHKIVRTGKWRTVFVKGRGAIVSTRALPSWQAFKAQRIRWVSKSTAYQNRWITLILVLSWLGIFSFPLLGLLLIWTPALWPLLLFNFLFKIFAEGVILSLAATFFRRRSLLQLLLPEQFLHIPYILWVGLAGNRKRYSWKGRMVR